MANQQMSAQQASAVNQQQRAMMLATAPRMRKNLGTYTNTLGQTTRVKLFNVGVITKLLLDVSALLTIGTAAGIASARGPWNLIARIRVTDFDGTDRVNVSGYQLWVLNCVRAMSYYGFNNQAAAAVFANPSQPLATGNQTVSFLLEIPIAFDVDNPVLQLQDLRGAIMAQTAVGEMYLNIDWTTSYVPAATADIDSLYSGTAGSTTVVANGANNISVTVWQDYLLPQDIGGTLPNPFIDLQTVYELNGNVRSTDNLAVGTEKLINYPNVRSVIGAYFNYVTAGAVAFGNMSQYRLIANGNNILRDNTNRSQMFTQRRALDSDLIAGSAFYLHRDKPIETALFGNIQAGLTPAVVSGGNQYMELCFESFYTKGSALPGVQQAG